MRMDNSDLVGDTGEAPGMVRVDMSAKTSSCERNVFDDDDEAPTLPNRKVEIRLPKKLSFLMELHRFKVLYGGRGGGKSWAVADALLALGAAQKLRILCAREVQESISKSVHQLLKDRIVALGLEDFYTVQEDVIRGGNGTTFGFTGLATHTVTSIKSYEGVDIVWVEEAQTVSKRSWDILIPTIRAKNSEIWVTFNPDMDTDYTWKYFIVDPPDDVAPFDCVSAKINYNDNKHFPEVLERERRQAKLKKTKEDYENIWEGVCRSSVVGAIYAKELSEATMQKRICRMPYDPRFQVHFVWDIGWNDAMSVVMVQKPHPSALNVINYFEDSFQRFDEIIRDLRELRYTRWGWHWLPHDGDNKNPQTGMGARQTLRKLGCRVKPCMEKTGAEQRIKAARLAFPRIYIDNTDLSEQRQTGYLGGARLLECLRRYSRVVPKTTEEPASPKHDQFSHGADAFGAMCEIADRIVDDTMEDLAPTLPGFQNSDPGMGLLG